MTAAALGDMARPVTSFLAPCAAVGYHRRMVAPGDVMSWIDRDIRPRRWAVQVVEQSDHTLTCLVTASRYVFTIFADAAENYLGCTCCTRQHNPGEHHPRFADLPDGKLTAEAWQQIVQEMRRMEIRPFRGPGL